MTFFEPNLLTEISRNTNKVLSPHLASSMMISGTIEAWFAEGLNPTSIDIRYLAVPFIFFPNLPPLTTFL